MNNAWLLKLVSIQYDGRDKESTELVTEATYERDENGDRVIAYEESETTGMEGSRLEIRVGEDDLVTIVRTGNFEMNLVVHPGRKHFCHYATPFGQFSVGVAAKYMKNGLTDEGGRLELRYTVDSGAALLSDNEIIAEIYRDPAGEEQV